MTTAAERTKAVLDTRDFLQMLSTAEDVTIRGLVQSVAVGLLRHYPLKVDLDVSASALPKLWAPPSVSAPCVRVVQLFGCGLTNSIERG